MRIQLERPSDVVIWGAGASLAIVLGIGTAFFLWFGLHDGEHMEIAPVLVAGFGSSVLFLGLGSKQPLIRAIVALFAVTLVLSFIVGSPSFARLV